MTLSYAYVVEELQWLMDDVESRLNLMADVAPVDVDVIRESGRTRRPTLDEVMVVIDALVTLGILTPNSNHYVLNKTVLVATAGYRQGIRDALLVRTANGNFVRLCAAIPPGLSSRIASQFREVTEDLRGSLMDLIAGSEHDVLLISPFWDAATLKDLRPVLLGRLAIGVSVQILGRFDHRTPLGVRQALLELESNGQCRLLNWYESNHRDPFGVHTFHLKAAVADRGTRAYLGTANFTVAGLRSRLELGVVLKGNGARQLAGVANVILSLAQPVSWEDKS